ncbi:nickel pincer cofactor biosynthesis protein LarC2 [Halobacillus mangrovi]|uniref:DUF111 family protein n=1 Tax=Halobacillus mangrovi TaxID=402384 RepID=A0A1W5ZZ76_9BACI|nr:nickel insertion protein [Halobacillus mangrovi]ARI78666.1 hypothetical protein HM131_18275 [Halobacillus mangrovi]
MSQPFAHDDEHNDNGMIQMEVNLDDTPGEWLGYVMEKLFEAGANDVFYTPIYMKKNRPGVQLQLLCDGQKLEQMKSILFRNTTTLGVRYYPITVHRLERRFTRLITDWGDIKIKEGVHNGEVVQRSPEYEDCKRIASEQDLPIKKVYQQIWKLIDRRE